MSELQLKNQLEHSLEQTETDEEVEYYYKLWEDDRL